MDKTILEDKKTVLSTDYTPQYEQLYIHPEEGEDFRINDAFKQIDDVTNKKLGKYANMMPGLM